MNDCRKKGRLSLIMNFYTDQLADIPYCKTIWILCENHIRAISSPVLDIQVQIVS